MKCPNCGNEVSVNEKICSNCGENNESYIAPMQPIDNSVNNSSKVINPTPTITHTNTTVIVATPSSKDNEKYEKFAKIGLGFAIASIVCFVIVLALTISVMGDAASPYPDSSAIVQKVMWVGLLFIAAMIVGILGIVFSGISLSKPHTKRGIAITGLTLSIIFTAICLIIYLVGSV